MKIDDRMLNYDIGTQPGKSAPEQTGKINGDKAQEVKQGSGEQTTVEQDSVVHLSRASREVQLINKAIESQPDVREDKVAEIKERIQSGKYQIDNEAVADKLVNSFIDELL